MFIFKIIGDGLEYVQEDEFRLEREIQDITEKNLERVFDLEFVKTEFTIQNFRLDTLAFDRKTNSFVIIEYKRNKSFSVVDQGYAYLSLMLNNKSDFILEYNENSDKNIIRKNIDWGKSRVVFISQEFTPYQKEAINFKDLPIELWEAKKYSNETISYSRIRNNGYDESINTISKNTNIKDKNIKAKDLRVSPSKQATPLRVEKVDSSVLDFEDYHCNRVNDDIWDLYLNYKSLLLMLGNVVVTPSKTYISFVANNQKFADFVFYKGSFNIYINVKAGKLDDALGLTTDVSNIGHNGTGDYMVKIDSNKNIDSIVHLIKYSYLSKIGFEDDDLNKQHKIESRKIVDKNIRLNDIDNLFDGEDRLILKGVDKIQNIYFNFRDSFFKLDNVSIKVNNLCLAYLVDGVKFMDIIILKNSINIQLNLKYGQLSDSMDIARDVSNIGTYGTGDYLIKVNEINNFDYILKLIKQAYDLRKN